MIKIDIFPRADRDVVETVTTDGYVLLYLADGEWRVKGAGTTAAILPFLGPFLTKIKLPFQVFGKG